MEDALTKLALVYHALWVAVSGCVLVLFGLGGLLLRSLLKRPWNIARALQRVIVLLALIEFVSAIALVSASPNVDPSKLSYAIGYLTGYLGFMIGLTAVFPYLILGWLSRRSQP